MSAIMRLRQARVLTGFLGVQSVVYGLNLASGVLLVRWLAPSALALYTVTFAAFTLLNVLADACLPCG